MRLAVYTDYVYRRNGTSVYAERAFALFLARLGEEIESLTILGRLEAEPGEAPYRLPDTIDFVGLPHYDSLSNPIAVLKASRRSIQTFWRLLGEVDQVWMLGPHPLGLILVWLALLRGKKAVLGVRQDTIEYAKARHPTRRAARAALYGLEGAWRLLSLALPTVVVGPLLARRYRHGRRVLPISVSLIRDEEVVQPGHLEKRRYDGPLQILSVGRIEQEKNPLLLADILAGLCERSPDWRLVVCGDGPMLERLDRRLGDLGQSDAAELLGYVPLGPELRRRYLDSHIFLHVSWTEGLPQVLFEAFAAAVPVVATDVGGIAAATGDATLLIPPGDREAAIAAIERLGRDPGLRRRLVERGHAIARRHTLDREVASVVGFLDS